MAKKKQPWENAQYQQITEAEVLHTLHVKFANGDEADIDLADIIPGYRNMFRSIFAAYNRHEITIVGLPKKLTIPWDAIRYKTDPTFAQFTMKQNVDHNKMIGTKIKALRRLKKITSKRLAEISGISAQTLSRIENGHNDTTLSTLGKILAAMGCTMKDLVYA